MSQLFLLKNSNRDNIVSYKDTVYVTRGKRIFKRCLCIFCILGILAAAVFALSDLLLPDAVGYSFNSDADSAAIPNEAPSSSASASERAARSISSEGPLPSRKFAASRSAATITGVTLSDATFTYDGTVKSLRVEGVLPEGASVTYTNNENKNAGVYEVTAVVSAEGYDTLTLTAQLTIEKAKLNQFVLSDTVVTYDGTAKEIAVSNKDNLPGGMDVSYAINDYEYANTLTEAVNAGKYWITATISGNENYEELVLRALLTIEKADILGAVFTGASYVFDNTAKSIFVEYDAVKYSEIDVSYVGNGKTNAGEHTVTATLGSPNYNTLTLNAVISIAKATIDESALYWSNEAFVFNGFGFEFEYSIDGRVTGIREKTPTMQFPKLYGAPSTAGVSYTVISGDGINAGDHTVKATVSGSNYENTVELTLDYVIGKADITGIRLDNPEVHYNEGEQSVTAYFAAVDKFRNTHRIYEYTGITIGYEYTERIIPGEHGVRVTLSGNNYNTLVIDDALTILLGIIDVSNIVFTQPALKYNGEEKTVKREWLSGVPVGVNVDLSEAVATNAGTHTLFLTLTKQYYEDTRLPIQMIINKGSYGGLNCFSMQTALKPLSKDTYLLPKFSGSLTEGTEVKYIWNGNEVDGLKALGTYNVDVIVSDVNRETKFTVEYWILPNPWLLLIGLIAGIIIAIITSIFTMINRRSVERRSKKNFKGMNEEIASKRGGIICESRVSMYDQNGVLANKDKGDKEGRLYLTRYALEYYDENFGENYKNFVIRTDDILSVDTDGSLDDKLIICSKSRNQVFRVPVGTASSWRREILHFKNMDQSRYIM